MPRIHHTETLRSPKCPPCVFMYLRTTTLYKPLRCTFLRKTPGYGVRRRYSVTQVTTQAAGPGRVDRRAEEQRLAIAELSKNGFRNFRCDVLGMYCVWGIDVAVLESTHARRENILNRKYRQNQHDRVHGQAIP
jgi:hypothetical protein